MAQNRIVSTLTVALVLPLWAVAQQTTPPAGPSAASPGLEPAKAQAEPEAPPTEAEQQIDQAIAKVAALTSVSAEISQDVKMLGLRYKVEGQYIRASDWKVYLQLNVKGLPSVEGRMLQVSDGQTLWDLHEIQGVLQIQKRQLAPILDKLKELEPDDELRELIVSSLGLSGPEALLRGLRSEMTFDQMEESLLEGRKVWIFHGRWKDRARLSPPNQPPLPPTAPLPPYVPSLAEVWIDQETGWPYWLRLMGKAPSIMETQQDLRPLGPDGRPTGRPLTPPKVDRSEIVLTYGKLQLNPKIDPIQFSYSPPQSALANVVDDTQAITNGLSSAIAERAARKRAEAAKEGPTELPRSIAVPPRPDGGESRPATPSPTGPPVSPPQPKP